MDLDIIWHKYDSQNQNNFLDSKFQCGTSSEYLFHYGGYGNHIKVINTPVTHKHWPCEPWGLSNEVTQSSS